ncbi:hypothetical protein [Burkholderia stagnalis]|uniref:hypothetical protein n=1 Tax=Burkholderia stagnalis TaxID=1503054 RepID=UPI0012DAA2CA|nr:hypothetical protein [Burkholderia stagnalis]
MGSFDRPLVEGALRLLGETISLEAISDEKIHALQRTVAAFANTVEPTIGEVAARIESTPDSAAKTRYVIGLILGRTLNFNRFI